MSFNSKDQVRTVLTRLRGRPSLHMLIDPITTLQVIGGLQLATRHPQLDPDLRNSLAEITTNMIEHLAGSDSVLLDLLHRGFDPAYDVPRDQAATVHPPPWSRRQLQLAQHQIQRWIDERDRWIREREEILVRLDQEDSSRGQLRELSAAWRGELHSYTVAASCIDYVTSLTTGGQP